MSPLAHASTSAAPLSTRSPHHVLSFTLCGEDFTYDLNTLEDDPRAIIEILKATSSARGNWMMVAAHYRRSGKPFSAISVAETMMTVMTEKGFAEEDLKPVLLFLSSCETDLAKLAKASKSGDAETHYERSLVLLQRVYGAHNTSVIAEHQVASFSTRPSPPCHVEAAPSRDIDVAGASTQATPAKDSSAKNLHREIRSLLEELEDKNSALAKTRNAKRKLEDDLAFECDRRRRLLRDYDELRVDLTTARKLENSAFVQVKREVEARRQAEDVARQAKARHTELERLLGQFATRPFAEIANTMKIEGGHTSIP